MPTVTRINDILIVLSNFGSDGSAGGADHGDVDFNDLITLLSAFGPCPDGVRSTAATFDTLSSTPTRLGGGVRFGDTDFDVPGFHQALIPTRSKLACEAAENVSSGAADFWSWRQAMYGLVEQMDSMWRISWPIVATERWFRQVSRRWVSSTISGTMSQTNWILCWIRP